VSSALPEEVLADDDVVLLPSLTVRIEILHPHYYYQHTLDLPLLQLRNVNFEPPEVEVSHGLLYYDGIHQ
jgi:hypothetical protein